MSKRSLMLLVLLPLVVCGILFARSCQQVTPPESATTTATPQSGRSDDGSLDPAQAAAARANAIAQQRDEAMYAAVSTLHAYLAALGGNDRAKADAFWANKRPPTNTGEADLRSLKALRAFRIQNRTPKPLDSEAVPNALEIPVELRVNREGVRQQRYQGWYRMRRAVADGGWEITSASVAAVAR